MRHMGQMLAADAKAHDDEMVFQRTVVTVFVFFLLQFFFIAPARDQIGQTRSHGDQARREHHGQDAHGQKILIGGHVEQAGAQAGGGQHKGEFAHLRQRKGSNDGRA